MTKIANNLTLSERKLYSVKDAYSCFMLEANNPENFHTLQTLKDFVFTINNKAGNFYPKKDDELDSDSTWFFVTFEDEIFSCMRIVVKTPKNKIPLENGFILNSSYQQYKVTSSNVADWNSVAFLPSLQGAKSAKFNFACVAQYCLEQNFNLIYGMFNDERKGIGRIYLEAGAKISKEFPKKIFFKDFLTYGETATFTIIEIEKNSLQKLSEILRS
ncbi:LBL_2463 family protein [Leptospira santarosai]|uniref:GNAT family N-acetyltransferase n=1 Tax=Leptospira santarosai str. MOR084 TaxID=1049984 RepID=A0A0E2BA66_9LEPT|nr:hypothetical protein [Leptospira santarosai]EKO32228.1 hypothetical protein LEP1GSC179_3945 [Leptospira santarosai str. MOR084]